jgi:deoxyribodipyrimidine photolyase-related protein
MRCLSDAITTVIEHGYAHHIVRLMLLGNFALIAGLDPLETNDWFASMFVDGYDWVMVPNVIGMTLHADGGYVGTKPYAASANYVNKMSNYCRNCHFNPKIAVGEQACPFNALYWDFMRRNQAVFANNHRMSIAMKALKDKAPIMLDEIALRVKDLRKDWC